MWCPCAHFKVQLQTSYVEHLQLKLCISCRYPPQCLCLFTFPDLIPVTQTSSCCCFDQSVKTLSTELITADPLPLHVCTQDFVCLQWGYIVIMYPV